MKVKKGLLFSKYCTYRIGGKVRVAYFPENIDEFCDLLYRLYSDKEEFLVVGGGSNILFRDDFYNGAIVFTSNINNYRIEGDILIADMGVNISFLSRVAYENSLSGFEFVYMLPGTVGGAVYMNARAYNVSISDVLLWVEAFSLDEKKILRLYNDEINFSYKDSIFQHKPLYILRVAFRLKNGDKKAIRKKMLDNARFRINSGHFNYPSCGSVFKNNYKRKIIAGKVIESLGFKGYRVGDAMVYEKHANFIINLGNATFDDVYAIIKAIREQAFSRLGILLEPEVRIVR